MYKDEKIYIKHILERSEKIIRFTEGLNEDEFLNDDKTQSAVIREFEVIGEATKRISDQFKQQYPQIPWQDMAGMRDIMIHDYEGVNPLRVWDAIQNDIPELITHLEKIKLL